MAWLAGWIYRREVTITNNVASELTNHQVPIDIDFIDEVEAGKAKADLTDIRVTDSDGTTLLDFFREYTGNDFGNLNNYWRWEENPVLPVGAGGTWDDFWVGVDDIINVSGTYYLYYNGSDDSVTPTIGYRIGLATSTDGITWSKSGSNPIISPGAGGQWDDTAVNHLAVVKEGANWYGWYSGEGGDGAYQIGYATSSDGISWTKYGSNPVMSGTAATWDSGFVVPGNVWKEGSTYYMIYWGGTDPADSTTWEIGLATSTDRVTWTKEASNPVLEGVDATWEDAVLDPYVVKIGSTYTMFYQGNTADTINSNIGIATSTNLTSWTKDADNPIPRTTTYTSEWDYLWNEHPTPIQIGTEWRLYYMGNAGVAATDPRQTGFMRFRSTRLWVKVPTIPSSSTATVYVYYGKSDAADVSSGADTFVFFEDFTGGTPFSAWNNAGSFTSGTDRSDENAEKTANNTNTNYYLYTNNTISAPCIVEVRAKLGTDWGGEYSWHFRLDLTDAGGGLANALLLGHYYDATTNSRWEFRRFASSSQTHITTLDLNILSDTWTKLALHVPATGTCTAKFHDDTRSLTIAADVPDATPVIQLNTARSNVNANYTTNFDKVWVRGYAATEPSSSVGAELSFGNPWYAYAQM